MMETETKKSSKWLKIIGTIAVIGVVIAVGRIVLRGFMDKSGSDESLESGLDGSHESV